MQILGAHCESEITAILPIYLVADYGDKGTMPKYPEQLTTLLELRPQFYLGVKPLDEDISLEHDCIFVANAYFIVYWSNGLEATCYYFIWLPNAIIKLI